MTTTIPRDVATVLDAALSARPEAEAVVARSGSLTYRQLDAAAATLAGGLWEWGVRPGDRVAACLPNDLDVVVAFHAVMRLGAIWAGVGTALAAPEKYEVLADCSARLLLTDQATTDALGPLRDDGAVLPEMIATDQQGGLWGDLAAAGHRPPAIDIDPHTAAAIAYTSGTTGKPRGIVHSQHNLLVPGAVLVADRHYGPDLRKGDCLPLTILNLLVLSTLLTSQAQGCAVVMDRRDAAGIVEWIGRAGVNLWNGVPAQLYDLARRTDLDTSAVRSLREVWSGGGDCSDDLRREFAATFHLDLRATYGLTEAPTVVAIDPPDRSWRPGASGVVLPHLSVTVLGQDDATASPGELCLSAAETGPWKGIWTPMLGYWDSYGVAGPHAAPIHTGDLGTVDDGWLTVVDRRKLVIIRGGANVYPAEVERVLLDLPGVTGAAVLGIADARLGQRVAAVIELAGPTDTESPSEATRFVEQCARRMARYKIPEVWAFTNRIPRNAMGKVVRAELSRLLATQPLKDHR